ncbi:Leucine-rich repeat 2 [Arabidopsis suecica]|uniref:Leucine-rich repeat 2 n=1 Tax=Arabidopsis suecica TaxID=45249 RepID=A0A8T1XTC1_ARASU|nr:Leucine-rich repeat 2 [Arabidopsis suecica]
MDSISELPDALLLKILSLLPTARDVVATMVLSKRWQPLWKMVPKLIYDDDSSGSFPRFVDRSLLLHEAPIIETLHFKLSQNSGADIGVWIITALKRCVRKLIIKTDWCFNSTAPVILPRSLYTGCSMLVKLKIKKVVLVDFTSPISFPSLKKLSLKYVKYPSDDLVQRLLSSCPVLKSLVVKRRPHDNVTIFTIKVPSLKSLVLNKTVAEFEDIGIAAGFVIDAPSLERLDILDNYGGGFCVIENEMPNIVEADVDVAYIHLGNILSSITSVKRLSLCLSTSEDAYAVGSVFHRLVHLQIGTCYREWLNLLMCLLRDSPKLQSLELRQMMWVYQPEIWIYSGTTSLDCPSPDDVVLPARDLDLLGDNLIFILFRQRAEDEDLDLLGDNFVLPARGTKTFTNVPGEREKTAGISEGHINRSSFSHRLKGKMVIL